MTEDEWLRASDPATLLTFLSKVAVSASASCAYSLVPAAAVLDRC